MCSSKSIMSANNDLNFAVDERKIDFTRWICLTCCDLKIFSYTRLLSGDVAISDKVGP